MLRRTKIHPAPSLGQLTEQHAKHYLLSQGLTFVAENVRYKFGEIDLVMREQSHIIFVEVRYNDRIDMQTISRWYSYGLIGTPQR